MNKMWRQGDVQLIKINAIPKDAKKIERKELAFGEVTGHAHRVDLGDLFQTKNGQLYLKTNKLKQTNVTHEEHKTHTFEPDCDYAVVIERQFVQDRWTKVVD